MFFYTNSGDNMKYKFLVPIFLSIIVGLLIGKVFFDSYDNNSVTVFDEKTKVYLLRINYKNKKDMENNFKDYDSFLYKENNNKYYLYIGITKSKKNAALIKDYYEKKGYKVYVEENIINDKKFISILGEYDRIFEITDNEDIENIEKIVVENYKEMVYEDET